MNQLTAKLEKIQAVESLHQFTFNLGTQKVHLLTLELPSNLDIGNTYQLSVKSTDIAIAKNLSGLLSYLNQLKAKVVGVNNGQLLSSIRVDIEGVVVESVITLEASLAMNLSVGDEVVVLVKGSEVSVCG